MMDIYYFLILVVEDSVFNFSDNIHKYFAKKAQQNTFPSSYSNHSPPESTVRNSFLVTYQLFLKNWTYVCIGKEIFHLYPFIPKLKSVFLLVYRHTFHF